MKAILRKWRLKTAVYYHLAKLLAYEIIIAQGGSSSSKTVSILQILGDIAVNEPGSVITVVGQDFPNLRRGALRDFKWLIDNNPGFAAFIINPDSDHGAYRFKNGSIIEFATYSNAQDAKSGKRDYLFVNEANGVPFEIFLELEQRTKKRTYIDYNPTAKFWAHTELMPLSRCYAFVSTFMDNEYCPPKIAAQIKGYFTKWKETGLSYWRNKWLVYGLGQTGVVDGIIFPDYKVVAKFPELSELSNFGYAVDWGLKRDPMAIAKCGIQKANGRFVGQELHYKSGSAYECDDLFPILGITKEDPIVAGADNLDGIGWLQGKGWNIFPADVPPGSILQGIELANEVGIDIVQGSNNWFMEMGNYMWKDRKTPHSKLEPMDKDNHLQDDLRIFLRFAVHNKGVNPKKARKNERQAFVI